MQKKSKRRKQPESRRRLKDPQAAREAARYEHPIPSRDAILALLADHGGVLTRKEIARALKLKRERDEEALRRRLTAMARDGQLIKNRRGGYGAARKMDLVPGRVIAHADGYGFLQPDADGVDLYLSPKEMRKVLHGDRILACVTGVDRRGRKEGSVVEVLERANEQVVGRFFRESGVGFVVPDERRLHQDVLIPTKHQGKAQNGQMVVVRLAEQPDSHRQPVGEVVEVLGGAMSARLASDIAILSHSIPEDWPAEALAEAKATPDKVTAKQRQGRVDLRDLPLVTIDGADARDFDDAVYCEPAGKGWRLVVAIADVSAYVKPGSALDTEAQRRGTSVYFPQRVVPMLPEALSNGICSLNPDVERLCLVAELKLEPGGATIGAKFYPAVMRSKARLTYDEVWAMLGEGDKRLRKKHKSLLVHLENLHRAFKALRKVREKRGAIDFDSKESQFQFTKNGQVAGIVPAERNPAHLIIEECMITANVAAAKYLSHGKLPAPYRVHPPPKADRLEDLKQFLNEIGLKANWRGGKPQPKDFSRLIERTRERDDAQLIQQVLLRTQSLAVYQPANDGHFGLALEAYTHFTSPIRRYPDLLVHRAIKHRAAKLDPARHPYSTEKMARLCESSSASERRAEEASRDVDERLKCLWLADHVGETFPGIVSGVTSFGIFVELRENLVQGLVHVTALPNDYYHFDPIHHRMTGERTNRVFRLADRVDVTVARVDVEDRKVDFVLA